MPENEKTLSDNQLLHVIAGQLEHLTADIHALAERLDRMDRLVTEFEPIIRLYASPVSAYTASRQARKEQRRGRLLGTGTRPASETGPRPA